MYVAEQKQGGWGKVANRLASIRGMKPEVCVTREGQTDDDDVTGMLIASGQTMIGRATEQERMAL